MRTWVDASAIIALDAVGEVDMLRDLLERVAITTQVAEEVFAGRESLALRNARGRGSTSSTWEGTFVRLRPSASGRARLPCS